MQFQDGQVRLVDFAASAGNPLAALLQRSTMKC